MGNAKILFDSQFFILNEVLVFYFIQLPYAIPKNDTNMIIHKSNTIIHMAEYVRDHTHT